MKNFFKHIKYLDIFPEDTGFIHEGKRNYRSYIGVSLSICVIVASIIVAFMFGKEVYERKTPSASSSKEFRPTSRIDLSKWPVFFIISDGYGRQLEDIHSYYDIKALKMNFTEDGKVDQLIYHPLWRLDRCNISHFEYTKNFISIEIIETYLQLPTFCWVPNEEAFVQNPYKDSNSSFILFDIIACNKSATKCADDYEEVIPEAYVQMFFINAYIDSLDFSNPVKYFIQSINQQITNTVLKRNFVRLIENEFKSDNGWMVEDYKNTEYYYLDSITTEINNIAPGWPLSYLWITLESPKLREKTLRTYMKVQDLFAKIGGIVNAFMIIVQLIFTHYLRYNYVMRLRCHLNPPVDNNNKPNLNNLNVSLGIISSNNRLISNNLSSVAKYKEDQNESNFNSNNDIINLNSHKNTKVDFLNKSNNKNTNIRSFSATKIIEGRAESKLAKAAKMKVIEKPEKKNTILFKNVAETKIVEEPAVKSFFEFKYKDISSMNYFEFISSIICCDNNKLNEYNQIREEIDGLMDIYNFTGFLKHNYIKNNPAKMHS